MLSNIVAELSHNDLKFIVAEYAQKAMGREVFDLEFVVTAEPDGTNKRLSHVRILYQNGAAASKE